MAQSINGIGTSFYGERDYRADGSYITTEWVIFIYFPLIPFRSLRVVRNTAADENLGIYHAQGFYVLEKMRPNWAQVFSTYALLAVCAAWIAFLVWLVFQLKVNWEPYGAVVAVVLIFLMALPCFLPFALRRRARRAMFRSHQTDSPPLRQPPANS